MAYELHAKCCTTKQAIQMEAPILANLSRIEAPPQLNRYTDSPEQKDDQ